MFRLGSLDHARFLSLSHPLKTHFIFPWSLRSRLKKGERERPGQGDEEGERRQGPKAAGSHLLESPPRLSPVKAKEAPSPVHFP